MPSSCRSPSVCLPMYVCHSGMGMFSWTQFNSHLNVFQSTGMHFIAVAFVRAMLTCELNIRTQCRILEKPSMRCREKRNEKKKRKGKSNYSTNRWKIYLVLRILSTCESCVIIQWFTSEYVGIPDKCGWVCVCVCARMKRGTQHAWRLTHDGILTLALPNGTNVTSTYFPNGVLFNGCNCSAINRALSGHNDS